ncbi:hypothetical protein CK203_066327 [Vitis vinifera]|uniref:Uncharacterized protein n=1 Tax=Vitis vinifera TaxID=29760 RepID=A0A438G2J1_VITVI|nr:hypothetical protein CK203_066327 [Vitis vinifera]
MWLSAVRGPTLKERMTIPNGPGTSRPKRWAHVGRGPVAELEKARSSHPWSKTKRKQGRQGRKSYFSNRQGVAEEAMRYDSGLRIERERGYGSSHLILYSFDRTPVGEPFDHWGAKGKGWSGIQRGQNFKKRMRKRIDGKKAAWPRDKNSANVGGGGEKFRLGKILRLEGFGCGWGAGECGDGAVWVFTGVYGPFTKEERGPVGRAWGCKRNLGRALVPRGLVDLPLQGGVFTWSGGLNNQSWARLDRRRAKERSSPFRFENMWLKVEGFLDLIRSWWREIEVRGTASYRLAAKMKELKQKLKVWNREVFGIWKVTKEQPAASGYWDRVESERRLSLEETELKKEAKESYKKWVFWKKVIGDNSQGRGSGVREGIANAYHQRLSEDLGWKADIEGIQLDQISQQEAESLEIPFSENEIHSA